ncbi:hypothetical protein PUN28_006225 [Cardiocondyla obscurior]|uniref:Uncharacterized protein n=1 Tax=Cardiocondyla obscurior TaxID=286306 RepID=A0AAW2GCH8_9HYME
MSRRPMARQGRVHSYANLQQGRKRETRGQTRKNDDGTTDKREHGSLKLRDRGSVSEHAAMNRTICECTCMRSAGARRRREKQ